MSRMNQSSAVQVVSDDRQRGAGRKTYSAWRRRPSTGRTPRDLELADAVADGDELRRAPDEPLLLDGADGLLELLHVGLVVPRLDLEGDHGLCIDVSLNYRE
jgi:hypothetical protein